jgi:UTP--glucose-1-phosphate uridylyltransferase
MITLAQRPDQPFHAVTFDGTIYDCGSKIGFLAANLAYGLDRAELAPALRAEIQRLLK